MLLICDFYFCSLSIAFHDPKILIADDTFFIRKRLARSRGLIFKSSALQIKFVLHTFPMFSVPILNLDTDVGGDILDKPRIYARSCLQYGEPV